MSEYSQGVCYDGAVILKDGQPITVDQIVKELNEITRLQFQLEELQEKVERIDKLESLCREVVIFILS